MKKLMLISAAFLCLLGCKKNEVASFEEGIVGTWELETFCKDVNQTECLTVIVPINVDVLVEFKKMTSLMKPIKIPVPQNMDS